MQFPAGSQTAPENGPIERRRAKFGCAKQHYGEPAPSPQEASLVANAPRFVPDLARLAGKSRFEGQPFPTPLTREKDALLPSNTWSLSWESLTSRASDGYRRLPALSPAAASTYETYSQGGTNACSGP